MKGFDEIAENPNYLLRAHNLKKLDDAISKFGENTVYRVFSRAIAKGTDNLSEEDASRIAKAYIKSIRSRKFQELQISRVLDGDQQDMLEKMLMESGELGAEDISRIARELKAVKKEGEAGRTGSAKSRLRLDETYRETWRGADGKDQSLGVEDILNNNAENLMNHYTRQITGAGEVAAMLKQFAIKSADGQDDIVPTFETLMNQVRSTSESMGMTPTEVSEAVTKMELLHKAVLGIPLSPRTRFTEALRMLRDFNFIRVMNQVGFAQLAEFGNTLGNAGFKATMQNIPAMRNIYRRAKDGHLEDELLDELESIWGIGTDRLRRTYTNRMDDYGVYEGATTGKFDNLLQAGKAITADISLMAPINTALQRMTGRAMVTKFANIARGGKKLSAKRMRHLGLTDEMGDRVSAMLREHASLQEGMLGRKVRRINIDDWTDQDAAAAFVNAIDRTSRRIIQENDIGNLSMWMTSDFGKSMIQFRSFATVAWQKQLLAGVHHRDMATLSSWLLSMYFGSMAYMGQTVINSVGREDANDYLDKRLSAAEVGKAAFMRAGYASLLPSMADTALSFTGFEPVFSHARTTGLASNLLTGNPSVDLVVNSGYKAGSGIVKSALHSDYDFSQQDARALAGSMAFQNAMVIRNGINMLTSTLPRYSQ